MIYCSCNLEVTTLNGTSIHILIDGTVFTPSIKKNESKKPNPKDRFER